MARSFWSRSVLVTWVGLGCLVACTSEDSVQAEFEEFVSAHNSCVSAEDCVAIYPGCPLGCYRYVNKQYERAAIDKAKELVADYERWGRSCEYDCVETRPPECEANRCSSP
ncbi:MAG TPA: hypothetical protein VFQ61_04960 [Polyangiaceae bacterium]|nr:hypothetical protein [Polyangiaceae bacterium]